LAEVEADLLRFLGYFGNPSPGREPIAGFSSHFDAAWLAVHMPLARRYFSHRTFDVSTLRQFARDCGRGDAVAGADTAAHRALADCRQAADCARAVARLLGTR
jgi:oligoribonuclease (3'-5' exoribonuclease)